jgi:hypothetical protein
VRLNLRLIALSATIAFVLPAVYGMTDCEDAVDIPTITAPPQLGTIPASGLFTASVDFPITLTSASFVQMEIQTNQGLTVIDVTSEFLPAGQSDFAGADSASADLDATALGMTPGLSSLTVRLNGDGAGGIASRAVAFTWPGTASCEDTVASALSACFLTVSGETEQCYATTGSACSPTDPAIVAAENQLQTSVTSACTDSEVQSLGYGAALTAGALADRLIEECEGHAATLAARVFGGPHGKVLAAQNATGAGCLSAVYAESAIFLEDAFQIQSACLLDDVSCVPATVGSDLDAAEATAVSLIDAACPSVFIEGVIGLPTDEVIARARTQSECMTSAAHGDESPLTLLCSSGGLPGVAIVKTQPTGLTPLAPGVPTQLLLDEAVWGTKCGDGSPYAFWVQLAPAGSPVENVVSHMQGGGVCVLQSQCEGVAANNPGLFESLGDNFNTNGVLSDDPAESAFADWTKIFLPYCNQDVFTGGGVLQDYGTVTVERYGAINARAALRVLRNLIAGEMNASTSTGYRPDLMQVLFGGSSAGGFGVMFNLHHVLDEERWSRTTIVNDAALGLDTGTPLGVGALGGLAQASWATRLTQPPYCLASDCAVGPVLNAAHSERLLGTPEQQLLLISNQVDNVQINTTGWPDTASFVNEVREKYCEAETLPGVHYFLDAIPSSFHTYLPSNTAYYTYSVAGVPLVTWVEQAAFDPTNLVNLVEEGTLTTAYPGVLPFGCSVSP